MLIILDLVGHVDVFPQPSAPFSTNESFNLVREDHQKDALSGTPMGLTKLPV